MIYVCVCSENDIKKNKEKILKDLKDLKDDCFICRTYLYPFAGLMPAEAVTETILLMKNMDKKGLLTDEEYHVLMFTTSPFVLGIIEVYAKQNKWEEFVKYYCECKDCTNKIEKVYKLLARPLQELENLRYGDE